MFYCIGQSVFEIAAVIGATAALFVQPIDDKLLPLINLVIGNLCTSSLKLGVLKLLVVVRCLQMVLGGWIDRRSGQS